MKEELKKLYREYKDAIEEAQLWTHESEIGFIHWILTGEL